MYFPSIYEGFEMVTLEALSSGLPVVGTDVEFQHGRRS